MKCHPPITGANWVITNARIGFLRKLILLWWALFRCLLRLTSQAGNNEHSKVSQVVGMNLSTCNCCISLRLDLNMLWQSYRAALGRKEFEVS